MKIQTLFVSLVLLATGGSLFAQNPTAVTGTILDPNSVPYYPAQVTACLTPNTLDPTVGGKHVNPNIGTNYCLTTQTAADGSFSLSLHANGNITPAATQWIFTVQTVGAAPPAGKGSQTFSTSAVTVSGSTQSVTASFTGLPALLNSGSGSGSTSAPAVQSGVVHLDPTCPVVATSTCYFWNADVRVYIDATTANGSNILTISGSDKAFTSTETLNNGTTRPWVKVGQPIFCTNGPLTPTVPVVLANTTVLSIDSATQIHTTGNAASNQTATAYCYIGDDDTANILAFWTALLTNCGNFGAANGYLSSGIAFTTTGQFNTFTTACSNAFNAQYTEPALYGAGEALTTIMPLGNQFDFTTGAGNSCQGGGQIVGGITPPSGARTLCFGDFFSEFSFINIWGGGYTTTAGLGHNVGLFGANARLNSDNFQGWMAQVPVSANTLYGVILNGGQVRFAQGCACYFGEYSLVMDTQAYQIGNFAQGGIFTLDVRATGGVQPAASYSSALGPSSGSASGCIVIVETGAQLNEYSDHITGSTGNIAAHCVQANATGYLEGSTVSMSGSGGTLFSGLGAGAKTQLQNDVVTGNSTATLVNMAASASLDDQCGNSFATFSVAFTGAGNVTNTCSAQINPCVTGNWGLTSGWGASTVASVGANGNSHKCKVNITGAAGSASPVLTWTFPQIYPLVAPSSCSILQVSGTFAVLTNAVVGTPSTTAVTFTFAGTPAANTYIFEATCGP